MRLSSRKRPTKPTKKYITDENKARLDGIVAALTTPELIFDGKEYGVNYNCTYTLSAKFQVSDSNGVISNTDIKNITVN